MNGLATTTLSLLTATALGAPARAADRALPATGKALPQMHSFDELMHSFLQKNDLPGAALAVARDGEIVYARGYGFAEMESETPVQPDSLFRIASISKPITAVAILQLVEQGKLALDDKVFEVLRDDFPLPSDADPRLPTITIANLLRHTGGWDRDRSFDPMFRSVKIAEALGVRPPARPEHIIRYMATKPLQFDPGQEYAYSNYGYSLLGRVIETITGEPYERAVRRRVLAPIGVTRMELGRTLQKGRRRGEVVYYAHENKTGPAVLGPELGKQVPQPYGAWFLEGFDAHGGWIGSAIDLVRFAADLHDPESSTLLSSQSLRVMFSRPDGPVWRKENGEPGDVYYGCGWMVRPIGKDNGFNNWHTGSIPGTSTILVQRHDGLTWAVLFNSRKPIGGRAPARAIDLLVHRAADAVETWPEPLMLE